MPAKTDFNVSPYWDDFNISKDFYRVLFRPGFAVQARELTQLQTILQNQIEQFGNHFFKEGTIVIPGSVAYDDQYFAVKFQSTFSGTALSTYLNQYVGAIITGGTSGVTAEVVGFDIAISGGDPDTLYVKYISSNTTDNSTTIFTDDEEISANKTISSYAAGVASAQLQATSASFTGSAASVTEGIFFVRGFMCRTTAQTITLDKYSSTPSYRIGFTITETLVTPEDDPSLLDNAQGSSNYAAKGAHRLKITLTLAKKTLTTADDTDFIELARVDNGKVVHRKKATEYSIVADMLARRTADESGDYVVNHFDIEPRENLNDGTNRGIYTAAQGGVETKDTLVISPGKAYVAGYEVDKQNASFVNIDKARTTKTIDNDTVPFSLGNYAKVDNVYSQPDVSLVGTSVDPFKTVYLYDKQTPTVATNQGRGYSYGTQIGRARSRAFEFASGVPGAINATYHHYLFDVSMYTKILIGANVTLSASALVTGATSGATGFVTIAATATQTFHLMQVEGAFQAGEAITSSVSGDSVGVGLISEITVYDFNANAKQIFGDQTGIDYTADIELDQSLTISGEVTTPAGGATTLSGTNTKFQTELVVGDVIQLPSGAAGVTEKFRVGAITNNTNLTFEITGTGTASATNKITSARAVRIRAKITEEEETVLVYKMPKENVKSLLSGGNSDTTYSFRKQFVGTTASGAATFTAGTGETFDSASLGRAYTLAVVVAGTGNAVAGDILNLSSTKPGSTSITGTGTQTLTITDATILGNGADVFLTASITVPTKLQKAKTANKMKTRVISSNASAGGSSNVFGERVMDSAINLAYADVYKLHAVYESTTIASPAGDPTTPTLTVSNATGTMTVGEVITGTSSGATGRVILHSPATTITYVALTGTFTTNDQVAGSSSGYIATITATATGSRDITSSFLLDTGQRDSFYDLGRAVRKPDAVIPTGQLLLVYDYFGHGAGDYFSVDSYTGQVDYSEIPEYSASKVDPESKAPIGFYELRDSLDFRPSVQDQTAPTIAPFAFGSKFFEGAGASAGNMIVPDDNIRCDFSFYLGRLDLLYLDSLGNFVLKAGISAEDPHWPQVDNVNMLIAKISIAPYTFSPERDVIIGFQYTRRYTMQDIGKLHKRIGNLEYATALGLLERQTDSFQLFDENGFDRFKSGFIVDTFYGHNIGNPINRDYECSMDSAVGHLRPMSSQYMVKLIEENTTDVTRASYGYTKTGDLITLPYTHTPQTIQPYASRVESVNPFSVTLWTGKLTLDPDTDIWMDTERAPSVTMNVEGNYDQMLNEQGGNATLDTVWDAWNVTWTGNARTTGGGRSRETNPNGSGSAGNLIRWVTTEATTTVDAKRERTGTNTRLVERIETQSTGDRIINLEVVPWIRAGQVNFTATGMKPNTRVYAFFDRVDVNAEVKPTLTSAENTTLNGALTKTATTVTVVTTTGFPATGTIGVGSTATTDWQGVGFIAQEQMTYTGKTSTTFTGVTRNTGFQFDEPQEWVTGSAVSNETYGTPLVTNIVGTLYGRFTIPATETKRFRVGTRTFRLTDSSTNSLVVGTVETATEAPYTASGMVQTKQEVILSVRNGERVQETVTEEDSTTLTSGGGRTVGNWYDPLAQTILCDQTNGMFLTKLDVFFSEKDDALPVWCEVRDVKNGYPGRTILPFSKVTLQPADVNTSATSATATTFTFPSPVFLQQGQEAAIVLASNSPNYKVWIARLGEVEIGGTRTISAQPTLGSLFKSQNASTWTPSQYEDLKFTIYRANFTTDSTSSFTMVNEELTAADPNNLTAIDKPVRLGGGQTAGIPTLLNNPIDTKLTQAFAKINLKNHGMYSTTNHVKIAGVISDIGSSALNGALTNSTVGNINVDDASLWPATGYVLIDSEVIAYTGAGGTQITIPNLASRGQGGTTAAPHEDNSIVHLYMLGGIPLTEINKTHTSIAGIETDSFLVSTTTSATASVSGGGKGVRCTRNIHMDVMQPLVQTMEVPSTLITAQVQTTTASSVNGSQTAFARTAAANAYDVPLNEDTYFDAPNMVASQINETGQTTLAGNKSFRLTASLSSTDSAVSPVIDTSRMGLIAIGNRLNNIDSSSDLGGLSIYHPSTSATGDNNNAIYITKKITLTQAATAIQVIFDAVQMSEADIQVLYKTLRVDTSEEFDDIAWTAFTNPTIPLSKSRTDFKEYKYLVGKNSLGVGTDLNEFVAFAIKIVLQGSNSSLPPVVQDFRAIAFQA